MIALWNRKNILKKCLTATFCALLLFFASFFAVKMAKENIFDVAAEGNSDVSVSYGEKIYYDDWATNYYTVTTSSGSYTGFCAQPSKEAPSGPYPFTPLTDENENNRLVKLIAYIYTADNSTTRGLMDDFYGDLTSDEDVRYAYVHATIGYIYSDDTYGLYDSTISVIEDIKAQLQEIVRTNGDAWIMAKDYKLFQTDAPSDTNEQSVVWIEGSFDSGNIKVQKCDKETNACSPQAGASLQGITFTVSNASGSRIYAPGITNPKDNSNFFDDGDVMLTGTTGTDGTVTFSNLPLNINYLVTETATNNSYVLPASADASQSAKITNIGSTVTKTFYDDVVRGDLKFIKTDQSDTPSPMANVAFRITNQASNESHIIVSDASGEVNTAKIAHSKNTNGYDQFYPDNLSEITYSSEIGIWFGTASVDDSKGALPYGRYTITELECDANKFCYDLESQTIEVTISQNGVTKNLDDWENDCADFSLGTLAKDAKDGDKFVEVNAKSKIKDTISYCVMPDKEYRIEGVLIDKSTGQELLINGEPVTSRTIIKPTDKCGTAEMLFEFDSSNLDGKELVVFERMYYDDELVASHEDINDQGQTINVISLATTATDDSDGDKSLAVGKDVVVKDIVYYCLKQDLEYTIRGVLMDKNTHEPLMINGKKVEQTITFTPEEPCGQVEMYYSFNTTDLGGADLVVFEDLYYNDKLILSHADFEDEGQSISVAPVPPETGSITGNTQGDILSNNKILIVFTAGGISLYVLARKISRKRFLNKKR